MAETIKLETIVIKFGKHVKMLKIIAAFVQTK